MRKQNEMMMGLFRNGYDAKSAYQELLDRGYRKDEIKVISSENTRNRYFSTDAVKVLERTRMGGFIERTVGTLVAALETFVTNVVFLGLGLVVAGTLSMTLASAGVSKIQGGNIRAPVGSGLSVDRARNYGAVLGEGGIILGFTPHNEREAIEVENVWQFYNGELLNRY